MGLKNHAAVMAVAAFSIAASIAPAAASLVVYHSRATFDSVSHIAIDWSIYGPHGSGISTPEFRTVDGLTLNVASSEGILSRHDEGVDHVGDFAIGDHLLTESDSLSDSFIVAFDTGGVRGFGMQVEPELHTGLWTGGIDVYSPTHVLLGTVPISGDRTNSENNSAPFYGIYSTGGDIGEAAFWIDQTYNSNLMPKAGDIAINTMDVRVPEPSSLALLVAALMGLLARRTPQCRDRSQSLVQRRIRRQQR